MTLPERHLHLKFLFAWLPPELLLKKILAARTPHRGSSNDLLRPGAAIPSREDYLHCAQPHLPNLSPEELQLRYAMLRQELQNEQELLSLAAPTVFTLPAALAEDLLSVSGDDILCRQKSILQWRSVSFDLGQDLFTCALAAKRNGSGHAERVHFDWPPLLRTDEQALRDLLRDGIYENHFHLNGSTQNFPITWGFLMNHPGKIRPYFQNNSAFRYNLYARSHSGSADNSLSWVERIYLAAWCRALLFRRCRGESPPAQPGSLLDWEWDLARFMDKLDKKRALCSLIERLRKGYGTRFAQPNGTAKVLDYAIISTLAQHNKSVYRFLTGERYLLYKCFSMVYQERFSRVDEELLYLYLLLKQRFRDELIQTNDRTGFRNFANYQDRKDLFWSGMDEYLGEARRMAVNAAELEHIVSLEMRISPELSQAALRQKISNDDWFVAFAQQECEKSPGRGDSRLLGRPPAPQRTLGRCTRREAEQTAQAYEAFYAVHFIKLPDSEPQQPANPLRAAPRNHAVRSKAEKQAQVLHTALRKDAYLCGRIRAIDAATFEIGCRPETFGTEFRFLRADPPQTARTALTQGPHLRVTYHVGEDFLDLADGLRAIDEAICFLNLQKGDRIGHALALGVAPETHYAFKEHQIFLHKQDLLDNLVWILFRCKQWGVSIPAGYQPELRSKAKQLLHELYDTDDIDRYFCSWQLRGDHSSLYQFAHGEAGPAAVEEAVGRCTLCASAKNYSYYKVNRMDLQGAELHRARKDKDVIRLVYQYHFDPSARAAGNQVASFAVGSQYIRMIRCIQDQLIRRVADLGISIECNPTSNVLIGTFREYGKHPIFRFNNFGLSLPREQKTAVQLPVSVNTDDKGVFDTSLEFEYALLMSSLQQRLDEQGNPLLCDDEILEYLKNLREMGKEMTFRRELGL